MKTIGLYLRNTIISLVLYGFLALIINLISPLSFEAGLLGIGTLWLLVAFLHFSRNQRGIVVGVGTRHNPLSSSVLASLNTNVEFTERSIDLDRINNEVHKRNKLYHIFIERTQIEILLVGFILVVGAFSLYLNQDDGIPPTDHLQYGASYRMHGLNWYTDLDDFWQITSLSEDTLIIDEQGVVHVKPSADQFLYYKDIPFEPSYTFIDGKLISGTYSARIEDISDYIDVTLGLQRIFTDDFDQPLLGDVNILERSHPPREGIQSILWQSKDKSSLTIFLENNNNQRRDPHYTVVLEVAASN